MTRDDILVERPGLSLDGATIFMLSYEQKRSKLVANGSLNRFLVLLRFERVKVQARVTPEEEVPEAIVAAARRPFEFHHTPPPGADPRRCLGVTVTLLGRSSWWTTLRYTAPWHTILGQNEHGSASELLARNTPRCCTKRPKVYNAAEKPPESALRRLKDRSMAETLNLLRFLKTKDNLRSKQN